MQHHVANSQQATDANRDHAMTQAFEDVWQMAQQSDVSLRTAAYIIGIKRVRRAAELAGFAT